MLAFPILSLKIIKTIQILIITDNFLIAPFTFGSFTLTRATVSGWNNHSLVPLLSFYMLYSLLLISQSHLVSLYAVKNFCSTVTFEYWFSSFAEELSGDGLVLYHLVSIFVNMVCVPRIFLFHVAIFVFKIMQ